MKRCLLIWMFIISMCSVHATIYSFRCFSDKPNFTYGALNIWYAPDLKILPGEEINAGLKIVAEFSTPENPINGDIISLGVSERHIFYPAFTLRQEGTTLQLIRPAKVRELTASFVHDCWTPDLLKPRTNYHIEFEVDETRCRIKLWERGHESEEQCEYLFYGLMGSEAKMLLSTTYIGRTLSLGTNRKYQVQTISIADLGFGRGVVVPSPPVQKSWMTLANVNSNMNFSLHDNELHEGISIVQKDKKTRGCADIWESTPIYMPSRMPYAYSTTLKNMLTSYAASIDGCIQRQEVPLVNRTTSTCDTWLFYRPVQRKNKYNLSNRSYGLYAVVKDASLYDGMTIFTYYTAEGTNSQWEITNVDFPTSSIPTGVYSFKNKYSGLFMFPRSQDYGDYALWQDNVSNKNIAWYVKTEPSGLVSVQNIDTKEYLSTYNADLNNRASIVQWEDGVTGNAKWIVEKQGIYNAFENLNSGYFLDVDNNYASRNQAEIMQLSYAGDSHLWDNEPFLSAPMIPLGGIIRIKNVSTSLFLGVEDASTQNGAEVVSKENAYGPEDWWTLIVQESGGVEIQNVNSQLFLDIKDASITNLGTGIQSSRNLDKRGHSLWVLERQGTTNLYRIKNVHSGKYLMFTNEIHPAENVAVIQIDSSDKTAPNLIWEIEWVKFN